MKEQPKSREGKNRINDNDRAPYTDPDFDPNRYYSYGKNSRSKPNNLHEVHESVKSDIIAKFASDEDLLIYDHFFRNGQEFSRVSGEAKTPDLWISVKDRLPEGEDVWRSADVLIYNENYGTTSIGYYWIRGGHWNDGISENITHWQPLTKPCKK